MSYTLNYTGSEIDDILDRAAPGGALDTAIAAKQDALTFDAVPTEGSTNPAESGGIYDAIQAGGATALAAFATDTVSGDVVSFTDGADSIPVKSFVGSILPVQDLNGQSAPYPAGGGKNKFQTTASTTTNAGVTFTVNSDGSVKLARASSNVNNATLQLGTITLAAGSYIVNGGGDPSTQGYMTLRNGSTDAWIANITASDYALTVSAETTYKLVAVVPSNLSPTNTLYPMIRLATEADATFAPYSNICPISGWTEANITRTGKNLYDPSKAGNITIPSGVTRSGVIIRIAAGDYTISLGSAATLYYAWNDGTAHESSMVTVLSSTFTAATDCDLYIWRGSGANISNLTNLQVEKGSTATVYEAYQGDTILLDFGQTVYAGTITALGGGKWSIQPTHRIDTLDGSETWTVTGSNQYAYYCTMPVDMPRNKLDRISNLLKFDGYKAASALVEGGFCGNNASAPSQILCYPSASAYPTADSWKAYLVDHPMQIVSELTTKPDPIIVSAEDLATLLGSNTVWTDVGAVTEMEYRADTALYIQKLLNGGGTLQALSMASPSPSLSLGRVGVLAEPEEAEPEQAGEETEQTEEPEQTEEA